MSSSRKGGLAHIARATFHSLVRENRGHDGDEIKEYVRLYAVRRIECGPPCRLDGVEIHSANGYLPDSSYRQLQITAQMSMAALSRIELDLVREIVRCRGRRPLVHVAWESGSVPWSFGGPPCSDRYRYLVGLAIDNC